MKVKDNISGQITVTQQSNKAMIQMKTERSARTEFNQTNAAKDNIIKLDFEMGLETLFNTLMAIAGISIGILLWSGLIGGKQSGPIPEVLPFAWIPLAVLALAAVSRGFTEVHRFIDPSNRALYQSTRFFNLQRIKELADSESALGIAPRGRLVRSKHSQSWHYEIVLVRQDGQQIPLTRSVSFRVESKFFKEKEPSEAEKQAIEDLNREAEHLASLLNCSFFAGQPRRRLECRRDISGVMGTYFVS